MSNLRNDLIESSNGDSEDLGKMKTLLDKLRELDSSLIREVSHYDDLDEPLLEKHLWDAHMSLLKARKILKNHLKIFLLGYSHHTLNAYLILCSVCCLTLKEIMYV